MAWDFFRAVKETFTGRPVDWDELEEMLIRADLGVPMTVRIIERLQERPEKPTAQTVIEVTRGELSRVLPMSSPPIRPLPNKPKVIMVVGVNGTGKTTSVAKLAAYFRRNRHSVLLVAADTFRAAAIEQLDIWAQRIGADMVKGEYNSDPAALCYDAYQSALKRNIEFVICDTAGRLHTRHNLMQELAKIQRVLKKADEKAPHEALLVVDATTGSNALVQTREFKNAVDLTGLIVTKLDGSGKGGVMVAIEEELAVPPRFLGTGEKIEDFLVYDRDTVVEGMI